MATDYRFIDKDPVIDVVRTALQRRGNGGPEHIARVAYDSGVSPATIKNWLEGETRRPLSLSTRFVLEALGVRIAYIDEENEGREIRQVAPVMKTAKEIREIEARDKARGRHAPRD